MKQCLRQFEKQMLYSTLQNAQLFLHGSGTQFKY
jgi:hypothetical protein